MAPKGPDERHRVSQLGTGKEMQKLRGRTIHLAAGGGAFRLSPHIKSAQISDAAHTLRMDTEPRGSLQKRAARQNVVTLPVYEDNLGSMGSFYASTDPPFGDVRRCRPVTVIRWLGTSGVRKNLDVLLNNTLGNWRGEGTGK